MMSRGHSKNEALRPRTQVGRTTAKPGAESGWNQVLGTIVRDCRLHHLVWFARGLSSCRRGGGMLRGRRHSAAGRGRMCVDSSVK